MMETPYDEAIQLWAGAPELTPGESARYAQCQARQDGYRRALADQAEQKSTSPFRCERCKQYIPVKVPYISTMPGVYYHDCSPVQQPGLPLVALTDEQIADIVKAAWDGAGYQDYTTPIAKAQLAQDQAAIGPLVTAARKVAEKVKCERHDDCVLLKELGVALAHLS